MPLLEEWGWVVLVAGALLFMHQWVHGCIATAGVFASSQGDAILEALAELKEASRSVQEELANLSIARRSAEMREVALREVGLTRECAPVPQSEKAAPAPLPDPAAVGAGATSYSAAAAREAAFWGAPRPEPMCWGRADRGTEAGDAGTSPSEDEGSASCMAPSAGWPSSGSGSGAAAAAEATGHQELKELHMEGATAVKDERGNWALRPEEARADLLQALTAPPAARAEATGGLAANHRVGADGHWIVPDLPRRPAATHVLGADGQWITPAQPMPRVEMKKWKREMDEGRHWTQRRGRTKHNDAAFDCQEPGD